jgi:two-component system, cell cycle sensor histidine kinase and response regulator CckA
MPSEAGTEHGAATILVVDDEASVRTLVRTILTRAGYAVVEASNGVAALEICGGDTRVDLVLSDIHMPKMDGWELAEQLAMQRPDIKIVLMSGNPATRASLGSYAPTILLLDKPFKPGTLITMLRAALTEGV